LKKVSKAAQVLQEIEEEFEGFLLTSDPAFLAKMRKARAEYLAGKTKPVFRLTNVSAG
jgi:hypothetical protein